MEYNVTEIIVDTPFGHTRGEAETLALLLASPLVDVKLIVLNPISPEKEFRLLVDFLKTINRDDVPIALGETDEGGFLRGEWEHRGKIFATSFEAYGAILPHMADPQVLCLGTLNSVLIAKPFLHQCRARLVIGEEKAKSIFSSNQPCEKRFEEIFNDPQIDLMILGDILKEKCRFWESEKDLISSSSSPFCKALEVYLQNEEIAEDESALAFAFAMSFPQYIDLEIKEIPSSNLKKEYVLASAIHKSRAMREVSAKLLCSEEFKGRDLQVAERKGMFRICYPRVQAIDSLYVYETGWEAHRPGDHYGPAVRDFFFLHYIIKGKGTLQIEGQTYPLTAGDSFVWPAGKLTKIEADPQDPYEYFWVGFGGHDAERLVEGCGFSSKNHYIIRPLDPESLKNELAFLAQATDRGLGTTYWMLGHLCLIFSQLAFQRPSARKKKKHDYVNEAIKYMNEFYYTGISISDVCAHISVERTYFFRRFKMEAGLSPQEYLVSLRIEKAKEMLRSSDKPVLKIAEEVGYPNYVSFLKIFSRKTGFTPTQYRGKHL